VPALASKKDSLDDRQHKQRDDNKYASAPKVMISELLRKKFISWIFNKSTQSWADQQTTQKSKRIHRLAN